MKTTLQLIQDKQRLIERHQLKLVELRRQAWREWQATNPAADTHDRFKAYTDLQVGTIAHHFIEDFKASSGRQFDQYEVLRDNDRGRLIDCNAVYEMFARHQASEPADLLYPPNEYSEGCTSTVQDCRDWMEAMMAQDFHSMRWDW